MNEYLTSNEQIAYPFKDDAPGLSASGVSADYGTPLLPADFLLSAVATYYGGEQLYLRSIADTGGGSYELRIGTATDTLVTGVVGQEDTRRVIAFTNSVEGVVFRAVTGPSFASYLAGMPALLSFGASLPFAEAAQDTKPYKLLSLGFLDDVFGDLTFEEIVTLQEGYNTALEYDEITNELTVNMAGGYGVGRYNPCEDPVPVTYLASVMGKRAADDYGSFVFGGDPCWRVIYGANGLTLVNDCKPCCECEDYEAVGTALQKLLDKLTQIWLDLEVLIDKYNDDAQDVIEALEELGQPRLYGSASVGKIINDWGYVNVTVSLHNPAHDRLMTRVVLTPPPEYETLTEMLTVENNAEGAIENQAGQILVGANGTMVLTATLKMRKNAIIPQGTVLTAVATGGGKSIDIKWTISGSGVVV